LVTKTIHVSHLDIHNFRKNYGNGLHFLTESYVLLGNVVLKLTKTKINYDDDNAYQKLNLQVL